MHIRIIIYLCLFYFFIWLFFLFLDLCSFDITLYPCHVWKNIAVWIPIRIFIIWVRIWIWVITAATIWIPTSARVRISIYSISLSLFLWCQISINLFLHAWRIQIHRIWRFYRSRLQLFNLIFGFKIINSLSRLLSNSI